MKCPYCGYESENIDNFTEDFINHKGFWCPKCDGFLMNEMNHQYILYKEDKNTVLEVNKTNIKKQVSPLRYPGGKSRMIDFLFPVIKKKEVLVEPFAGGASVSLALLMAGEVDSIVLNDIDFGWYSLFFRILYDTEALCEEIMSYEPHKEDYKSKQYYMLHGYPGKDMEKASIAFLVINRCAFSGIPFASYKTNINERWNPETLCKRIRQIALYKDRITVLNKQATEVIEKYYWNEHATLFIDPPYIGKGDILYVNKYTKKNHKELSELLEKLCMEFPCADVIITYDDDALLNDLYHIANVEKVGTRYSLLNKRGD